MKTRLLKNYGSFTSTTGIAFTDPDNATPSIPGSFKICLSTWSQTHLLQTEVAAHTVSHVARDTTWVPNMTKPNNPRTIADLISIDAWRTPYSGINAQADVYIHVVFSEARLGEEDLGETPVRFRLSLKKAAIHVKRDELGILRIPPASVNRMANQVVKSDAESSTKRSDKFTVHFGTKPQPPYLDAGIKIEKSHEETINNDREKLDSQMRVICRKGNDESLYIFEIEAADSGILLGNPWGCEGPILSVQGSNATRTKRVPPELKIEIKCKREDLAIEDIQFKENSAYNIFSLKREKIIAAEQYIKLSLLKTGLPCGDLSDPFHTVALADAILVEA
ncbi:hypothetical protein IWQ54_001153 [Labrenzia sp. EL_195]|nr:hypothetical protein [Labrenzia sp. EL_195]